MRFELIYTYLLIIAVSLLLLFILLIALSNLWPILSATAPYVLQATLVITLIAMLFALLDMLRELKK